MSEQTHLFPGDSEATRTLLDQLLTDSRLYTKSKDYADLLAFVVKSYVSEHTTIDQLDLYQVMRAAGQVETLLGLTAHTRYDAPQPQTAPTKVNRASS